MYLRTLGVSLAGTVLLALFALTPVQASGYRYGHGTYDGYGHGRHGHGHHGHHYNGSHGYRGGYRSGYRGKRRAHLRPHGKHGHGHSYAYAYRGDHRRYRGHAYPDACHPVSEIGYWYGYKARIGGTLCYDRYGRSYILAGSRYLIHYLGY